ncbi:HEPN domain-containing protein [Pseudomonas oryzihabitans]|uniref:HEPN domain-containing protein n=1 Tax=Pseudomonas oryzihabitans TaxID=47885 RepID=UPI00289EC429|nr:HEPN domain-containing protein [Pseudomonas oryzihabitans]
MASQALEKFKRQTENSIVLRKTVTPNNLNLEKQIYYHASLASLVASWDSFVKAITTEFVNRVRLSSTSSSYSILHKALEDQLTEKTKKLNTPNHDNARNHILAFTGYDVISVWNYPKLGWTNIQVKNRLDEIFKVRHSFAHGFSLPKLSWTTNHKSNTRLKSSDLEFNERFLTHLAKTTDRNLSTHMKSSFGFDF